MIPNRQPQGQPTSGQFAIKSHPESEAEPYGLLNVGGTPQADDMAQRSLCGGPVDLVIGCHQSPDLPLSHQT